MKLEQVINFQYELYAHTSEQTGKKKELLQEHIELCWKYYNIILSEKKISDIFENIFVNFFNESKSDIKNFVKESLDDVILFHDTGKINPLFQDKKMGNYLKFPEIEGLKGANHSFFSAFIYLDYECSRLSQLKLSRAERKKLRLFLFMNAYIISRHHGDLTSIEEYKSEFEDGGQAQILLLYLKDKPFELYKGPFYFTASMEEDNVGPTEIRLVSRYYENGMNRSGQEERIILNLYMRLLYSVLVSADYYAASEYETSLDMTENLKNNQLRDFCEAYNKTNLIKTIRKYEKDSYKKKAISIHETNINILRTEMFLDAQEQWKKHQNENIFFLEAPTGSGKSNCAMNLSFQMLESGLDKIWYIYPFNTLIEQNYKSLEAIFGENEELFSKITVVNSVTPVRLKKKAREEEDSCYQEAILDRQFLNYGFILTTHVSFFRTLFDHKREDVMGFWQTANSVVVLDEIQSYRNAIWSEIIVFLKVFAKILNMKIIIMSATLPNLSVLTNKAEETIELIQDKAKYYYHPLFRNRVNICYELLEKEIELEDLLEHILSHAEIGKKILVEFITKKRAESFFQYAQQENGFFDDIYCLTGDDTAIDRKRVLKKIEAEEGKNILLVATQVIEAGVDIDMDIGYKDISKLDSEEQFMGRINRSCKKEGIVYFFDMDKAEGIYKNDIRIENKEFTLKNPLQREILEEKNFNLYYGPILEELKKYNKLMSDQNLNNFFQDIVGMNDFRNIAKRMELIPEEKRTLPFVMGRILLLDDGKVIDGRECWKRYKEILMDCKMNYAKKQFMLSQVKSKLNYFIYEISKNADVIYDDRIGELCYLENGEEYFMNGRLDREKLEGTGVSIS